MALVEDERARQAFTQVNVIRLEVGLLGHAEPEALRFCFDAVAAGTIADGCLLEIEIVAGEGRCGTCRRTAPMHEHFAACPDCVDGMLRVTAGDAVRLVELEVE